ncbi:MAG: efflux RND transporter periplasmic adaptor subunit [Gemmatimonadota bacterium]
MTHRIFSRARARHYQYAFVGLLSIAIGCKKAAPPQAPPPPEVGIVTVQPKAVPESFEFTAEVQPYRRIEVRARVDGIIGARPFTEGSLVKTGEVLYRLDGVRQKAAFENAQARADNAKRALDRLEPLVEQHAVAQQDVDNARTELQSAQAALTEARKNTDDAVIRAPIDGRVGRTLLDVGARVSGSAELLTTIDVIDPIYVSFSPSTQQVLGWRQDPEARRLIQPNSRLTVEITLPDGSKLPRTGRIDYVSPSLDPSTGTQEFRSEFKNSDRLLVPGQFVRARLSGFVKDSAVAVPQRSVLQALGRQYVYVVTKGDTAVARDIQPGQWSGDLWIIEKGLAAGDRVVVDGVQKVAPGQPVHPVPATDSAATSTAQQSPSRTTP